MLILLPGRTADGAALLLARALTDIGVSPVLAPQPCSEQEGIRLLAGQSVTCLAALSSQLRAPLKLSPDGRAWPDTLNRVLVSGEPFLTNLRPAADAAGIEIFAHSGLTETCFGDGAECEAHQGYRRREADLYVEIVDSLTGEAVEGECEGEVVVSTLSRRGMPLLRYRTGDIARMLPGPCPCGGPFWRLGPITGRIENSGGGFHVVIPEKGMANKA